MFCRTVERCGCKSGPVKLCLCSKSLLSSAGCSAQGCCACLRPDIRPAIDFFSACCRKQQDSQVAVITTRHLSRESYLGTARLSSASDKTTVLVVSIYSYLPESWTPAGGSVLQFGYGSQRQAPGPAVNLVCTLRSSSDSHQTRASGISLKRITRPYHFC
jgi:hypothetical protein